MPGVALAAFIMAYIDVLTRFAAWGMRGGHTIPIMPLATLALVIAANNKQKWARTIYTAWLGFGVICAIFLLISGECMPLLAALGIALSVTEIVFLWLPQTSEWFVTKVV